MRIMVTRCLFENAVGALVFGCPGNEKHNGNGNETFLSYLSWEHFFVSESADCFGDGGNSY